ncbi:MAG: hypothetical protein HY790_01000 [Deltaproteobacteria bacterium]|nr:hypothetical protein [Deltaproteobacteria bacterium]MBI4794420.1 hypothetical protein [Deltaproteobacteria bacterium]
MNTRLKELIEYCSQDKRVCPQPIPWNRLWEMLPNKERKGIGWNPPLPLILGAWWETSDVQKAARFKEHLIWAYE